MAYEMNNVNGWKSPSRQLNGSEENKNKNEKRNPRNVNNLVNSGIVEGGNGSEKLGLLKSIFPSMDSNILQTILIGHDFNLQSSIDAALALNVNLDQERGFPVLNIDAPKFPNNNNYSSNQIVEKATPKTKTKKKTDKVILPDNFLRPPRFRLILDSISDAYTNFSIIFRRNNQKLGITVQEISHEIVVRAVHSPTGLEESLAVQAGVQSGDILIGINHEYFSEAIAVSEVIELLTAAIDPVTLHFLRKHLFDDSPQELAQLHKCASILVEQNIISLKRARHVSSSIIRLKKRTLQWDSGWISQRIQSPVFSNRLSLSKIDFDQNKKKSDKIKVEKQLLGNNRHNRSMSLDPEWSHPPVEPFEPEDTTSTSQTQTNIAGDMVVRTKRLRPALAIRILRSEYVHDHFVFVIWVLDVKTGAEWLVRRRFREFYEFREILIGIRSNINTLEFPSRALSITPDESRLRLLQKWLRRVSCLVSINSLHPTTSRVQLALQKFLDVEERLESLAWLELSPYIATRQMLQVFVHSVLNLNAIDEVISQYIDRFCDLELLNKQQGTNSKTNDNDNNTSSSAEVECNYYLTSIREFIDNLQGVLLNGIYYDCEEIALKYATEINYDLSDWQSSDTRTNNNSNKSTVINNIHHDNNNKSSVLPSDNIKSSEYIIWEEKERIKRKDDTLRKVIRSAIRRQIEILIYVPCCSTLRSIIAQATDSLERQLQKKISLLSMQTQEFFGICSRIISPSDWHEVVCSFRQLQHKTLPQDRLEALLMVAAEIPKLFQQEHPLDEKPLGADEFLPVFIFCLVRSRLSAILTIKDELLTFCDPDLRMSEMGYYTATFEAAIHHILELDENDGSVVKSVHSNSDSDSDSFSDSDSDNIRDEESDEENSIVEVVSV